MGRDVPVVGTVRRSCSGTGREGEVRVMGAMEIVGVAVLVGILLDWPMRACSIRGGDWDCIVNRLLVVLKGYSVFLGTAKVARNNNKLDL
jgi:hypothetical protein